MEEQGNLAHWLAERCKQECLTVREAAAKTGLSHATIANIISEYYRSGSDASPETIKKLAQGFGRGDNERLVLEDHLLMLAGYRTVRPEEELSEPLAQLMDKAKQLNNPQLKIMTRFADFLTEIITEIEEEKPNE